MHDPLCPIVDKHGWPFGGQCLCDLICKVEDRAVQRVEALYRSPLDRGPYVAQVIAAIKGDSRA